MSKVTPAKSEWRVHATAAHSPIEISMALSALNVSHSVHLDGNTKSTKRIHAAEQPAWVHVTDTMQKLKPGAINLIVLSYSQLQSTNIPRFPRMPIDKALRSMLTNPQTTDLTVVDLSPMDYVNLVAKPSLLNHIQTEIYKINPYGLRKETQEMVLKFFTGKIGVKAMNSFLQKSLKQASLIPLIESGVGLRDAVMRVPTEGVAAVAKATGYSSFDLAYLSKERK